MRLLRLLRLVKAGGVILASLLWRFFDVAKMQVVRPVYQLAMGIVKVRLKELVFFWSDIYIYEHVYIYIYIII